MLAGHSVPAGRSATRFRHFVEAVKLRIGLEIALAAIAGGTLVRGDAGSRGRLLLVTVAVLLSACAAGAFNQYAEVDIDARMRRTRRRPFVTGVLRPDWRWPWSIGITLAIAVALAIWSANASAAAWVLLGALTYGVVYTVWLKRRTWLNIVVGGFAGSFALLAGAAAVDPTISPEVALLAIALFFWTPPHFWSLALYHKADYAAAGIPMLPVLLSERATACIIGIHVMVVAAAAIAAGVVGLGGTYLAFAVAGSAWFLIAAARLLLRPEPRRALACFRASLLQLSLLLVGAIADGVVTGRF